MKGSSTFWSLCFVVVSWFTLLVCHDAMAARYKEETSPKWKVGDCVQSQDFESFETPLPIRKILAVGKRKYHVRELRFYDRGPDWTTVQESAVLFETLEDTTTVRRFCPSKL